MVRARAAQAAVSNRTTCCFRAPALTVERFFTGWIWAAPGRYLFQICYSSTAQVFLRMELALWQLFWIQAQGKSRGMSFPRRGGRRFPPTKLRPHSTPWDLWAGCLMATAWSRSITAVASQISGHSLLTTVPESSLRIFTNRKSTPLLGLQTASASRFPAAHSSRTLCLSKPASSFGQKAFGLDCQRGLDLWFSLCASAAKFPRLPSFTSIIHRG